MGTVWVMPRVDPDELAGSMATLGLVIEQPKETVRHIGKELDDRFKRSRFSRATAQTALERFAGPKHRWVKRCREGEGRSLDRYVVTPKGLRAFQEWMYGMPSDEEPEPRLREAMYGRIELCKLEHIPRLLHLARAEEAVSADLHDAAQKRLKRHLNKKTDPLDFVQRARNILLYLDPMHWGNRQKRYQYVIEALEEIIEDMRKAGLEVEDV